jgi:hypothetical protein
MKELKKKVIVIEESPYGSNIFESTAEKIQQIGKTNFRRKKNPNKRTIFQIINKWKESLSIVHYKDNDFLNVFVNGGTHSSRFVLSRELLERLVSTCTKYIDMLNTNEVDQKSSNIAQK